MAWLSAVKIIGLETVRALLGEVLSILVSIQQSTQADVQLQVCR